MPSRDDEKIQSTVLSRLTEHAQRAGTTVNELLTNMLDERDSLTRQQVEQTKSMQDADDWSSALRAWAARHPLRTALADDSRDGIYEGRGE
jgi:hypothetical protein